MNSKAFTLIEVLGIFTIIGIILIVALPQITGILGASDENKYEEFVVTVENAAEVHYQINEDTYSLNINNSGDSVNITIGILIDEGLIVDLPTKPSGEVVNRNDVVRATLQTNGTMKFNFID